MNEPDWNEHPILFQCEGDRLLGIAAAPKAPIETGVIIIVGGPQYRAGSHRQFTLLARHLAKENIASLRFDYRGMGDSEGEMRSFEQVSADIQAAIDALYGQVPSIRQVVLWGLCDAASAALFYGPLDPRIKGMVLLNPWVHNEHTAAQVKVTHYYWTRLRQSSFWTKLFSGEIDYSASVAEAFGTLGRILTRKKSNINPSNTSIDNGSYIDRMLAGLRINKNPLLVILSGNDQTAQEFDLLIKSDKDWQHAIKSSKIDFIRINEANHTFSSEIWRNLVAHYTADWILRLPI